MGERATCALGSQAAQLWLKARLDVVKVPAKPLDLCGALADEVLAVIEQEPDLTSLRIEVGNRQVALSKRRAGDREGIDRIRLAELACGAARARHQLRRDANHALSSGDQLALEAPGDVATVLERKQALLSQGPGPFDQTLVTGLVACDRQLVAELTGWPSPSCGRGVALLVGVDADRDHRLRSSYAWRV